MRNQLLNGTRSFFLFMSGVSTAISCVKAQEWSQRLLPVCKKRLRCRHVPKKIIKFENIYRPVSYTLPFKFLNKPLFANSNISNPIQPHSIYNQMNMFHVITETANNITYDFYDGITIWRYLYSRIYMDTRVDRKDKTKNRKKRKKIIGIAQQWILNGELNILLARVMLQSNCAKRMPVPVCAHCVQKKTTYRRKKQSTWANRTHFTVRQFSERPAHWFSGIIFERKRRKKHPWPQHLKPSGSHFDWTAK